MSQGLLVWMDLEMTGLDLDVDRILEMAVLITGSDLNIVAEGPEIAVHQDEDVLARMNEWEQRHHAASGLVDRVRRSDMREADAENAVLLFIRSHVDRRTAPLCGNSIWQDRRFIAKYMAELDAWLHYRNVDVSTLKELVRRWHPTLAFFEKQKTHTALSDIRESIAELRYYRQKVFVPSTE